MQTYEGSVRYVQAARASGLRTAVVSPGKHSGDILQSAGLADLFDARIDEGAPAPESYLAAAQALGIDAELAVVFEDEVAGVAAARAAHFGYVVGVDRLDRAPCFAATAPIGW